MTEQCRFKDQDYQKCTAIAGKSIEFTAPGISVAPLDSDAYKVLHVAMNAGTKKNLYAIRRK